MKILVTGASGFIGRQCCAQLSALGFEVHAVSSKFESNQKFHWHKADLLDGQQAENLLSNIKPTHLLHLAWYTEPGRYWTAVENYYWVKASLTLFEAFSKCGGERVVVAGSCAEYGWGYQVCSEEITPLEPETLYGSCKHSLQLILSSYAALTGLSFAWGRIFSIYGPFEHSGRLCSSVIQSLLSQQKTKFRNGALIRDYLHVSDVASAFVALLESDIQGPINIGSGFGIKLGDIVGKIGEKIDHNGLLEIDVKPISISEAPILVANNTRIKNIGWQPVYDIESGLDHTIDWFRNK